MEKQRAVVFGCGYVYQLIRMSVLKSFDIIAFLDNNASLWGKFIDGATVCKPEAVVQFTYDKLILASSNVTAMACQLEAYKVPPNVMVVGWNFAFVNQLFSGSSMLSFKLGAQCEVQCTQSTNNAGLLQLSMFNQ